MPPGLKNCPIFAFESAQLNIAWAHYICDYYHHDYLTLSSLHSFLVQIFSYGTAAPCMSFLCHACPISLVILELLL